MEQTVFIQNFSSSPNMLSVDINGDKKGPNLLGHDLFMFEIMANGKLMPMGAPDTYFLPTPIVLKLQAML